MDDSLLAKDGWRSLIVVLLTLALYLSGFFVILTPLPILYMLLKEHQGVITRILLPACVILLVFYLFLARPLYSFYESYPQWSWLVPLPGHHLIEGSGLFLTTAFGVLYFLFFAGIALVVFRCLSYPKQFAQYAGGGTLILFILCSTFYLAYSIMMNTTPREYLSGYMDKAISDFILIQSSGNTPLQQLAFLQENKDRLVRFAVLVTPSLVFCSMLLIIVINLLVGKRFFAFVIKNVGELRFNEWSMPFYGVWMTILGLGLLLLNSYLFSSALLTTLCANTLIILSLIYYLQGLSIVSFSLETRQVRPLFKMAVYFLIILLFQTVGLVILGLGFFDAWADLRHLSSRKKAGGIRG